MLLQYYCRLMLWGLDIMIVSLISTSLSSLVAKIFLSDTFCFYLFNSGKVTVSLTCVNLIYYYLFLCQLFMSNCTKKNVV